MKEVVALKTTISLLTIKIKIISSNIS